MRMKKGSLFRRMAALALTAMVLLCSVDIPLEAAAMETVETEILNIDFSGSAVGGSIAGNGNASWGRVVGVTDGSSATVKADETGNTYGTVEIGENANSGKSVSITALYYKAIPYDDIVVRLRARIHDYNSTAEWVLRMDYDDAGITKEQVTSLLSLKQGTPVFLGNAVDSSVWEKTGEGQEVNRSLSSRQMKKYIVFYLQPQLCGWRYF